MKFNIYKENGKQIIAHFEFPKFKKVITFDSPISDVEDIKMLDRCNDPMILARAMREAGEFIQGFKKLNP